jgi:hypothetical protein
MSLERWKPAVPRHWLLVIAGLMWSAVGVMLCLFAASWLSVVGWVEAAGLGAAGVLLGLLIYRMGFHRIVRKNIDRIEHAAERPCLFSFQAWKSYLIVIAMIVMGAFLRHSMIPKPFLAVLYETMGLALFLASLHYYANFRRIAVHR